MTLACLPRHPAVAYLYLVRCNMRALALFMVVACTGCEGLGYGYVNARSSPVPVVREDSGVQHSFTLAARHRLGPFIHDRVPDHVAFYDSRGRTGPATLAFVTDEINANFLFGAADVIGTWVCICRIINTCLLHKSGSVK
jgi:hypothetical protein